MQQYCTNIYPYSKLPIQSLHNPTHCDLKAFKTCGHKMKRTALTVKSADRNGVGPVVEPLRRMRADVGL